MVQIKDINTTKDAIERIQVEEAQLQSWAHEKVPSLQGTVFFA
jgi:hypothetical protein